MSSLARSRVEFQRLAETRLAEAKFLLGGGMWDGAYYLAGYAIESALKACIAKLMKAEEFPDKDFAVKCYTHNLDALVVHAGLKDARDDALARSKDFTDNWTTARDWSEATRYHLVSEDEARALILATEDPPHGILQWVKTHW